MSQTNTRKIPIILPSKIIRGGESKKIDDIIRDELDSDKVFSNKTIYYPNLSKMIDLSVAYGLVQEKFGKKSKESKKFRQSCSSGENMFIYYSIKTDSRYIEREQLYNNFLNNKIE
jgi:hypothetical protein